MNAAPYLSLALVCSLGAALALAADLTGTWQADLTRRGDVKQPLYLVLRHTGDRLDGRVLAPAGGELPLLDPHFEGADAVFHTQFGMTYRLHPEGDTLRVTVRYEWRETDVAIARRVAEQVTQPPAAIPLPALREMPANGLAATPPMGWNSWNRFGEWIDDRTVREMADALVRSGLAAAGYVYVSIDDTWQGTRDEDGQIRPNGKFPDMKALGDYIHSRGLKFGIYSSPGETTCAGYAGSYGHEDQDARTYAAWGVDLLKYDWCSAGRIYGLSERRAACQRMAEALAACGRPIVFSLSVFTPGSNPSTWASLAGANLWRTTSDIHDNWVEMSAIGFGQNEFAPHAGPGRWNDPDMLEVGNGGMSDAEYRTHFTLWCLLAAPLLAGNDLRDMSPETLAILGNTELIAVDQDPLGRQGTRRLTCGLLEIWAKPLADGSVALGIFNRGESANTIDFAWSDAGGPQVPRRVRDLWAHCELASIGSRFTAAVPAHGTVALRIE